MKRNCIIAFSFGLLLAGSLKAQNFVPGKGVSLGVNAGTVGLGVDITTGLTKKLNIQLAYNTFEFGVTGDFEDQEVSVNYSGNFSQRNFSLLADFYPFKRGFKISAGLYSQNFLITAQSQFNEPFVLNEGLNSEKTFDPERLGKLDVKLSYPNNLMPYIGFGFGNPVAEGSPVKLNISLGLMYSGKPTLDMIGEGLVAPTVDHAINFQKALDEFPWFPVLKLGLSVRIINKLNKSSMTPL